MSDVHFTATAEYVSAMSFEATMTSLSNAITEAGLIIFNRFDHQAGALQNGLEMPPATVLTYGHPKGGTPVMLAAPLAALDLPLRVLVHARNDGRTMIAFHPMAAVLIQAGVPQALATRLDPAQDLLVKAVTR